MTTFDFDRYRDRLPTASTKWGKYRGRDVLPFWVADMDFDTAPAILARLHARIDAGVLGYTEVPDELIVSTVRWLHRTYGWQIDADWLVFIPAVVGGFNMACRLAGAAGDEVLIPIPVYYPFRDAPTDAQRSGVEVPLQRVVEDGHAIWRMDLAALQRAVTPRTRMLLLCNPQNPTGRVYSSLELNELANFCLRNDLLLMSDEIHCPLVLHPTLRHQPIAALNADIAQRTITLMSPNKAYNIPGVGCGFAVIPNPALRERFKDQKLGLVPSIGPLAFAATHAALEDESGWLEQLIKYLRANAELLHARINDLGSVRTTPVEGTYLAWIDVRDLALADAGKFFEQHGLGLSDGPQFGGPGFARFNFGCPRSLLERGLDRFAAAVAAASR